MASAPPRLRIFVASPGDVAEEREIALSVLDDLPYDPLLRGQLTIENVAWDKRGAGAPILAGVTPQESIARGLPSPRDCDIVVVIFWSRMGTPLPEPYRKANGSRYESGTEWEYEDAVSAFRETGSPYVLLYRRKQPLLLDADDPAFGDRREQYERVKRFFAGLGNDTGYNEYAGPGEFRARLEYDLRNVIARILAAKPAPHASTVALPEPWTGSPFPGLRAFTANDEPIFFGRERETDALIVRILEHWFVAVVGASGSGKSSLVAAGVIPRLQRIAGSTGEPAWLILQLTPDALGNGDPFTALAAEIRYALPRTRQKALAAKLREQPDFVTTVLPTRTLVFVDQFEELFTTVQPALRGSFVETLSRARVIVTVRADFYGHCVELPALARLVENSTYPLSAPGVGALHEMITRPAARAALAFEDGLPQRILDDTGQEPGALALMAYTLDELYRRGLTHAAYEELEGVQGAIGKRSETVFSALDEEERSALPRVFRELVEVDERGTATRQRAPLARVAATPAARRLTEALTDARLLVPTRGENNEPVVEVAHEALFRSWPRLAAWIAEAQDDLRLLRQVRTAAAEWDLSGRRDPFLWPHERLEPVYALRDRLNLELEDVAAEFIRPEAERIVQSMRSGLSEARERAAIERLEEIGPPAAQSLVACLPYAREDETLEDIYQALSRLGEIAVPLLLSVITSVEAPGRQYAVTALTHVDPRAGTHLLPSLLADEDPNVRAVAAFLAAHARADHVIPVLCTMLKTDGYHTQEAALVALATFDSKTMLDHLLWAVEQASFSDVAIELFEILTGEDLEIVLFSDDDGRLLPLISSNPAVRRLPAIIYAATVLSRRSAHDRRSHSIVRTLEILLSPKAIEAAVSAETSVSEIEKLFDIIVRTLDGALVELLSSPNPRIQLHAVRRIRDLAATQACFTLTGSPVLERLGELLRHDDNETRDAARAAIQALQRLLPR